MPYGDLFDLLDDRGALPERERQPAMQQILRGISCLHCDIKPENVLVAMLTPLLLQNDFGFPNHIDRDVADGKRAIFSGCCMLSEVIDARARPPGRPLRRRRLVIPDLQRCGPVRGSSLKDSYAQATMTAEKVSRYEWGTISEHGGPLTAALLHLNSTPPPNVEAGLAH